MTGPAAPDGGGSVTGAGDGAERGPAGAGSGGSALVSVDWLRENASGVVILDASIRRGTGDEPPFADGRPDFEREHVPGARFADLFREFSDGPSPLPFMRPDAERIRAATAAVGITDASTVVVYDRLNGAWAARVWWVLRSFGFERVFVLDGGLAAWTGSGGAVETGAARPIPASTGITPDARPGFFIDPAVVRALSVRPDPRQPVVCALRRDDYLGDPDRPGSGHIPQSINLPYPDTLDAAGRHDPARTRELVAALDIPDTAHPVLYCGGGINAAGLALALHEIGRGDVTVFDGSLAQWRAEALPLQVGPPR
jgi:thiosulfate/3-mercaptopyruvate sulfurtransferase